MLSSIQYTFAQLFFHTWYSISYPAVPVFTRNCASFLRNHARDREMSTRSSVTHNLDDTSKGRNVRLFSTSFSLRSAHGLSASGTAAARDHPKRFATVCYIFRLPMPARLYVRFSVTTCFGPQREQLERSVRRDVGSKVCNTFFIFAVYGCACNAAMPRRHIYYFAFGRRIGDQVPLASAC